MKRLLAVIAVVSILSLKLISITQGGDHAKILVIRKGNPDFTFVYEKMKGDLQRHFKVDDYVITKETPYEELKSKVSDEKPSFMILMDNQAVAMATKLNSELEAQGKAIRGVALMGLNLKEALKGNKYISGIAFESPAYTLVTSFRSLFNKSIKNVVVYYRKSLFEREIAETRQHLKTENINLEAIDVEASGKTPEQIEKSLSENVEKRAKAAKDDEVCWVMLDNVLLTPSLFSKTWIPTARGTKMPFLIGVENLVRPEVNFAVYGVTPNLADLAGQAVQMVELILRDQVKPSAIGVENLIAVDKVLNSKRADDLSLPSLDGTVQDVKVLK